LRQAVGLQPALLDAIGDGLNDLAHMLAQPSTAALDARTHLRLAEVEGHHAKIGQVRRSSRTAAAREA
jgi:hypothetical protein